MHVRFGGRVTWIPAVVEKVNPDGTFGVRKELASDFDLATGECVSLFDEWLWSWS